MFDFSTSLDRFINRELLWQETLGWRNLEFSETDDGMVLILDLPGMNKEDISLTMENSQTLLLVAERKGKKGNQTFAQKFLLPRGIDSNTLGAEYKNGVLEVTGKKREEDKPKKIPIKVT
jgi:HSP20 family protein